jgi:hypothetical protein
MAAGPNAMRATFRFSVLLVLLGSISARGADTDIVINELMYHPPGEREDLQYIELLNRGREAVDLSGWSFQKGVRFEFPSVSLPPGDLLVIARDTNAFAKHYGVTNGLLFGNFTGKLSHGGETVSLANRDRKLVDAVHYLDSAPWPHGADGYSPSLERICPAAATDEPANWAASSVPAMARATGSPLRTNNSYAGSLPPIISEVIFTSLAAPGQPVTVAFAAADSDGIRSLRALATTTRGPASPEHELPLQRVSGDAHAGRYEVTLPGQASGALTRFRIEAVDDTGATRSAPGANEPAPTFSVLHFSNTNTATVPFGFLLQTESSMRQNGRFGRNGATMEPARGSGTFVYVETNRGAVMLFDHVHVEPRSGGWNVHLNRNETFKGMSSLNIIFEAPRWTLSEALGYEVFRRIGVPAPEAGHMRIWENGRLRGYHLFIEQINKAFLSRRRRDNEGDLFKLLWYGRGVVGQHEKKTNPLTGHTNLLALIRSLEQKRGVEQWEIIRSHFNVDEVADYFAVNQLIGNWDGFHNNQYVYHDLNGIGKWELYPWDLDKTFGDFDGAPPDYAWYDMPLSYGMEGDVSPSLDRRSATRQQRGPFGGLSWWRAGGYFSRPLLANPEFRLRFLARLQTHCETEFTEEKLYPWLNDLRRRLDPEVRLRAALGGGDASTTLQGFYSDIESLRQFIKGRRAFLLRELKQNHP